MHHIFYRKELCFFNNVQFSIIIEYVKFSYLLTNFVSGETVSVTVRTVDVSLRIIFHVP